MFDRQEPPISLFSFQDIITSLTGIMIFFLLLLSLYIMELAHKNRMESPLYRELAQIKDKNAVLKKQISDISSDVQDYRKRIRTIQKKDEVSLKLEQFRLEKKIQDMTRDKIYFDKKIKEEKDICSRLKKDNAKLHMEQKKLAGKQKQIEELKRKIEQKKRQISQARKAIERRRKEVQVTVDSSINKIPVLIECSIDKICIVNTQNRQMCIFSRQGPVVSDLISNAMSFLQEFSADKYYFVFMVKPSAANYIRFFQKKLTDQLKNADFGTEPIFENEGGANE